MGKRLFFIFLLLITVYSFSYQTELGRVTFTAGDPVLINSTGQVIHARPELEFSNHSRIKTSQKDKLEIFVPDIALFRVKPDTSFLIRYVGDEVQIILEYGNLWIKVINNVVVRWDNFQVKSSHGVITCETLINDMFKVSCIDGKADILDASELKTTLVSTDRAFLSRNRTIDEVNFSINTENIKWMDFKRIIPGKLTDKSKTAKYKEDSDFVLPPGMDEELLVYSPAKKVEKTNNQIVLDFISPRDNMVNVGSKLRVAGRVNTIMVKSLEVYLDDSYLGNIEVKNFRFEHTFNVSNPSRAKFLDVVARDVYGSKAVFTKKLIPDTDAPLITIVPPFNTKKTQFFKGYIEDLTVKKINVTLNKGTVFEENFDLEVKNGFFEFRMSVDNSQSDAINIRYGSNYIELKAYDEFGNEGFLKNTFFINQNLIQNYFDK